MKVIGNPISLPDGTAVPLSAGMETGDFVVLSGQLPIKNGELVLGGIVEQTNAVIDNIEQLLVSASCSLDDVVKSTVWLTDAANFAAFNTVYGQRFTPPYPARSTVVSGLLLGGAMLEIEVLAHKAVP